MAGSAIPPASASSPCPIGGDGARAVVTRGTGGVAERTGADGAVDGSEHLGPTGHNGTGHNGTGRGNGVLGNGHHVPGVDVAPRAAILPAAPPGLAPEEAQAAGEEPAGGDAPAPGAAPAAAEAPSSGDVRDRLLAMLLPDPARAVVLVAAAEQARDAARQARRELVTHRRDLDRAAAELLAQGLTPDQLYRLLELTDEESADRGGRHGEPPASAPAAEGS